MSTRCLISLLLAMLYVCPAWAYRLAVGSYVVGATASDNRDIVIDPPFRPISVVVKCNAVQPTVWYIEAMGADSSVNLGTVTIAAANKIQQMNANGFQVGTDADVQPPSVSCYYMAFGDNGRRDIAVGSYAGNGVDGTNIVISPAFLPGFVMVKAYSGTAVEGSWKTASHTGGTATSFSASADSANWIQLMNVDGFQLGTGTPSNGTSRNYAYMAIKSVPDYNDSSTYTGNTSDNREIASIANPTMVFLKPSSTTSTVGLRFGMAGDLSGSTGAALTTNIIQNFSSAGFQIGTSAVANENGVLTHFWTSRDPHYRAKVRVSR